MESKRLFLAFKLPENLLIQLQEYQKQLDSQIFRIVDKDQLHLTLIFLGEVPQEKIEFLKDIITFHTQNFTPQYIQFSEIKYGPNDKFPRLIWLQGVADISLEQLKKNLEKDLRLKAKLDLKNGHQKFLPHITLARIKSFSSNLPLEAQIKTNINFSFSPLSLWLIESQLHKKGAQYFDLKEFPFKKI